MAKGTLRVRIIGDASHLQKTLGNAGGLFGKFGKLAKRGGLAVAAGIGASAKAFIDFDGALNESLAIMGDVSDVMRKDMSKAAREVAKVTKFSAKDAAESYFFLASAGLDAESSIKALPRVAKFAQAGMFDMALATDLLTDAQSALGLTIRDDAVKNMTNMVRVSDVLVKANTLANASVEQFSTALTNKAGAAMRSVGMEIEEGVAVLAAFADQGIKAEEAGTQFSIVLRDLQTKAIENKGEFKKFGVAVFDSAGEMRNMGDIVADLEGALAGMSDEQKKTTLLTLGFSDKSVAAIMALIGMSDAIKTYEGGLRKAGGTTETVANKQMESLRSKLGLLKDRAVDVGIALGEKMAPHIEAAVEDALGFFDQLPQWWAENSPKIVGAGREVVTALKAVFSGGTEGLVADIEQVAGRASGAVTRMSQDAIGQIHLLNAQGKPLSKDMADSLIGDMERMRDESVRAINEQVDQQIQDWKTLAVESDEITGAAAAKQIRTLEKQRKEGLQEVDELTNGAVNLLKRYSEQGDTITDGAKAHIVGNLEEMRDGSLTAINEQKVGGVAALEALKRDSGRITTEQAAEVVKASADQRRRVIDEAVAQRRETVEAIERQRDLLGTISRDQADRMIEEAQRTEEETIESATRMHYGNLQEVVKLRPEVVEEVHALRGEVTGAFDRITNTTVRTWDGFKKFVEGNPITPEIDDSGIAADIERITKALHGGLGYPAGVDLGAALSNGIRDGIRSGREATAKSAENLVGYTLKQARRMGEVRSPSKLFAREVGLPIAEGVALGIYNGQFTIDNAMTEALTKLMSNPAVAQVVNGAKKIGVTVSDELAEALSKGKVKVADAMKALGMETARQAREAMERVAEQVRAGFDAITGGFGAAFGRVGAARGVRSARQEFEGLQRRKQTLPAELVAAEIALRKARAEAAQVTLDEERDILQASKRVTDAEKRLLEAREDEESTAEDVRLAEIDLELARKDLIATQERAVGSTDAVSRAEERLNQLREEEATLDQRLIEAKDALTEAQLRAIESQRAYEESMKSLVEQGAKGEAEFRRLAEAIGLTTAEIDRLIRIAHAIPTAAGQAPPVLREMTSAEQRRADTLRKRLAHPKVSAENRALYEEELRRIEGRAMGGPVRAGQPYWVGENRRPELFVPGASGSIVPQHKVGGTTINVNVSVNVGPGADPVKAGQEVVAVIKQYERAAGTGWRS